MTSVIRALLGNISQILHIKRLTSYLRGRKISEFQAKIFRIEKNTFPVSSLNILEPIRGRTFIPAQKSLLETPLILQGLVQVAGLFTRFALAGTVT